MVCERKEQPVNPNALPTPPQSFEERISRVRLWTVIPVVLLPILVWRSLAHHLGLQRLRHDMSRI
jgi:hypothetical protein